MTSKFYDYPPEPEFVLECERVFISSSGPNSIEVTLQQVCPKSLVEEVRSWDEATIDLFIAEIQAIRGEHE